MTTIELIIFVICSLVLMIIFATLLSMCIISGKISRAEELEENEDEENC